MLLVVDTHALVWYLSADQRLSQKARKVMQDETIPMIIPAIVLAEFIHLKNRGRIIISSETIKKLLDTTRVTVFPIDRQIMDEIPGMLDIHDALIVATTLVLSKTNEEPVFLATRDETIAHSGLVRVLW